MREAFNILANMMFRQTFRQKKLVLEIFIARYKNEFNVKSLSKKFSDALIIDRRLQCLNTENSSVHPPSFI